MLKRLLSTALAICLLLGSGVFPFSDEAAYAKDIPSELAIEQAFTPGNATSPVTKEPSELYLPKQII